MPTNCALVAPSLMSTSPLRRCAVLSRHAKSRTAHGKPRIAQEGQSLALELLSNSDQADGETECRLPAWHGRISGFEDHQKPARYPEWLTCQSAQEQIVRAI